MAQAPAACALFLGVVLAAGDALASQRQTVRPNEFGFKGLLGVGIGASGASSGTTELQAHRSWYGLTPVASLRYDFLFNTPPPESPSGSSENWPNGLGLVGGLAIQYRPLFLLGPEVYERVDVFAGAGVLVGTMKEQGQYRTSGGVYYCAGVDVRFDRVLILTAEYRHFAARSDFTMPYPGAPTRSLGRHEVLLGFGFRTDAW